MGFIGWGVEEIRRWEWGWGSRIRRMRKRMNEFILVKRSLLIKV